MKFLLTTLALLFFIANANSQDLVILKNGTDFKAKISEVTKTEIKYKKIENLNGPNYSIDISDVFMIRYENGTKDVFTDNTNNKQTESAKTTQVQSTDTTNLIYSNDVGRIKSKGGKYVYINSTPLAKYTVVFRFQNLMSDEFAAVPSKIIQQSIENANKASLDFGGAQYDGILVEVESEKDVAIKFTNPNDDYSLCTVSKLNEFPVFIACEPVNKYEVLFKANHLGHSGPKYNVGANPSITKFISSLKNNASEKTLKITDAIFYEDMYWDKLIKFLK